jgi:hypothetical protein
LEEEEDDKMNNGKQNQRPTNKQHKMMEEKTVAIFDIRG